MRQQVGQLRYRHAQHDDGYSGRLEARPRVPDRTSTDIAIPHSSSDDAMMVEQPRRECGVPMPNSTTGTNSPNTPRISPYFQMPAAARAQRSSRGTAKPRMHLEARRVRARLAAGRSRRAPIEFMNVAQLTADSSAQRMPSGSRMAHRVREQAARQEEVPPGMTAAATISAGGVCDRWRPPGIRCRSR